MLLWSETVLSDVPARSTAGSLKRLYDKHFSSVFAFAKENYIAVYAVMSTVNCPGLYILYTIYSVFFSCFTMLFSSFGLPILI